MSVAIDSYVKFSWDTPPHILGILGKRGWLLGALEHKGSHDEGPAYAQA